MKTMLRVATAAALLGAASLAPAFAQETIGTMQVIPTSGDWASQLAGRRLDLLDTQDNITAGVVIIRALQVSAEDREQAIAGYYQGLRSVRTQGMFKDTKQYVAAVLAHYKRL